MRRSIRWSRQALLDFLRKYERKHGYVRSHDMDRQVVERRESIRGAARRLFGTFGDAKEVAGIEKKERWSKSRIVEEIRKLFAQNLPLNHASATRAWSALVSAAERHFGTWRRGIRAAGIPIADSLPRYRQRSKFASEAILEAIRREWRNRGDVRTSSLRKRYGVGIYQAGVKTWGSWPKTLLAAGVPASVAQGRMRASSAARGRIRPGVSVSFPCRQCSTRLRTGPLVLGATQVRCGSCTMTGEISLSYGSSGWEVRTG